MNVALRSHIDDVRGRILDAAERLGDQLGEEGITMRQLASAAGVPTAVLYQCFEGKAALLSALETRVRARHDAALASAFGDAQDPWARLHRICVGHVAFAQSVSWQYKLAFANCLRDARGSRDAQCSSFLERVEGCLSDAGLQVEGRQHTPAPRLWVAVHGLASALTNGKAALDSEDRRAADEIFVDDYVRMLLRGIRAELRDER